MNFKKIISLTLILIMCIYIVLSSFEGLGNTSYAGQYISIEQAEQMAPGITGLVNNLKSKHPNYNFQFYNTGIEWSEAILREYQGHGTDPNQVSPKNLFHVNSAYSGKWFCPVCGTTKFDNGLCCASMDALRYMMDPRNSLSEDSVFQFKSLETPDINYSEAVRIVQNTFLADEECVRAILEASEKLKINGYYLVAKMVSEHGAGGSTLSRGVVVNGVTYYNLFNVGAYGGNPETIIANGAQYAANAGWTTRGASIIGGAEVVRNSYVGKGQNTAYYQKFNVVNGESLFSHQYAQNILAAENEGRKLKENYLINGQVVGNHTFIIPLYSGMSQAPEARPKTAVKNSIQYETAVVTANGGLKVRSKQSISSAHIGSIAQGGTVKVLIRAGAPNATDGYYWDLVISDSTGLCGYVARNYVQKTGEGSNAGDATQNEYVGATTTVPQPTPQAPIQAVGDVTKVVGANLQVSAKLNKDELLKTYPGAVITNASGQATDKICTGGKITVNGTTYTLVKKGDVNGDGDVNILDTVSIINHIKQTSVINDQPRLEAAQIKCESTITVTDVVALLNYIKESVTDIKIK